MPPATGCTAPYGAGIPRSYLFVSTEVRLLRSREPLLLREQFFPRKGICLAVRGLRRRRPSEQKPPQRGQTSVEKKELRFGPSGAESRCCYESSSFPEATFDSKTATAVRTKVAPEGPNLSGEEAANKDSSPVGVAPGHKCIDVTPEFGRETKIQYFTKTTLPLLTANKSTFLPPASRIFCICLTSPLTRRPLTLIGTEAKPPFPSPFKKYP